MINNNKDKNNLKRGREKKGGKKGIFHLYALLYQYTQQKVNKVILAYDFGDLLVEVGRSGVVFPVQVPSYFLTNKMC